MDNEVLSITLTLKEADGWICVSLLPKTKDTPKSIALGMHDSDGTSIVRVLRPIELQLLIEALRDMKDKQENSILY